MVSEVSYGFDIVNGNKKEETMSRQKITRRDALGMIAKTGVTLGAGTCFFLSLKTSPLAAAPWDLLPEGQAVQKRRLPRSVKSVAEKVVISGSGSTLIFRISGPEGRHCGIDPGGCEEPAGPEVIFPCRDRQQERFYRQCQRHQGLRSPCLQRGYLAICGRNR